MGTNGTTKKKQSKPRKAVGKGNAKTAPRPEGRPPLYSDPIILQAKVDEYFATGRELRTIVVGPPNNKRTEQIALPTITGLVLFLGFCDRHSFYEYEKKEKFSHVIKSARSRMEKEYECALLSGLGAGAIFGLKNFGWIDKVEVTGNGAQRTVVQVFSNHKPPEEPKADDNKPAELQATAGRQDSQPLLHPQADDSADDS